MALFVRTIGIARARTKIGMANLVYNMKRLVFLNRPRRRLTPPRASGQAHRESPSRAVSDEAARP